MEKELELVPSRQRTKERKKARALNFSDADSNSVETSSVLVPDLPS